MPRIVSNSLVSCIRSLLKAFYQQDTRIQPAAEQAPHLRGPRRRPHELPESL